jgi:hypothetical protein
VKFQNRVVPTEAQLRWQINMSLAYGAKGILYFTYWTPEIARGENFESALINVNGTKTPLYDISTRINKQWLAPIGRELKPLVSVSATHANDNPLPPGTEAFTPDEHVLAVEGGAVVVGQFRAAVDDGRRWVLVVNRSDTTDTTVTLTFGPAANRSEEFQAEAADFTTASADKVTVQLAAGGAALFRLGD